MGGGKEKETKDEAGLRYTVSPLLLLFVCLPLFCSNKYILRKII